MEGPKKNKVRNFTQQQKRQLAFLFGVIMLAFLCLLGRIIYLNVSKGDEYKRVVLSQGKYGSTTLPYQRGSIIDCNGNALAVSKRVYNVILDSSVVNDDKKKQDEHIKATANALSKCFGANSAELISYMKDNPDARYYVIKKRLDYEELEEFKKMVQAAKESDKDPDILGVWFEEEYKRYYPGGSLACDVIGYTNAGNAGAYGLEEYYNSTLNGTNGRVYGYLNDDVNVERTTIPAIDGNTLVTTIDANIQRIVEEKLKAYNDEYFGSYREGENGSKNIGCIIMKCDTGEVLAMAGYPVFDLNNPKDLNSIYTLEQLEKMDEKARKEAAENAKTEVVENTKTEVTGNSEETSEDNQNSETSETVPVQPISESQYAFDEKEALAAVWKNYCISETYEPGSVAKPFTVAIGLDSGKMSGEETYFCGGLLEIGGHKIRCHNRNGDGEMTVKSAIAQSCNVSLMHMGQAIGKEVFLKYFEQFNFGLKTNIDLTGEARTASLVFTNETMGNTELATSTFGQGFNVTMIEMITAFNSLVNGGYYYEPHMVKQILSADGAVVQNIEPRVLKQTISNTTSQRVIENCNAVVTEGTGKAARPAGYKIGGKTGTAETAPRGTGNYVVSFMGYAPADDPEIIIYVVIDRPNMSNQENGTRQACLICKEVLTEVLPYMNIFMTEELSEKEIAELQEKGLYNANLIKPEEKEEEEPETSEETLEKPEMKIDPATGYGIDPYTGEYLDPETGYPIDPNSSFMDDSGTTSEEKRN